MNQADHAVSPISCFYLERLTWLLVLDELPLSVAEQRLVRHALFSTYLACREAGVTKAAQALLALRPDR